MTNFIQNRKARFHYELGESFEAGIELFGFEVKSIKSGRGNFDGAYVIIRGKEAFLIGASIPAYQASNTPESYDPERNRRLLLSKKEVLKLQEIEKNKGLTLVPVSLYNKGRLLKVSFAIGHGKRKTDKRQSIRKREDDREMERTLKKLR
jgi:SsrA-binding protein